MKKSNYLMIIVLVYLLSTPAKSIFQVVPERLPNGNWTLQTAVPIDLTLVPGANGSDVVDACLQKISAGKLFSDDFGFMRRIANVESSFGTASLGSEEELLGGIWKITPTMHNRIHSPTLLLYTAKLALEFDFDIMRFDTYDYSEPLLSALAARLYIQAVLGTASVPRSLTDQALWWSSHYNPNRTIDEFENSIRWSESEISCRASPMDIWFLLDGSGSVGQEHFNTTLKFITKLSEQFLISPLNARMGMAVYSDRVDIVSQFDQHTNNRNFTEAILATEYLEGYTRTGAAIEHIILNGFSEENGARPLFQGVPRILIVLTDGQSGDDVEPALRNARAAGITMFGIGIGFAVRSQIDVIADNPNKVHAHILDNFEELSSVLTKVIPREACTVSAKIPSNALVAISVERRNVYYFAVQLSNNGSIQLIFSVGEGEGNVYFSTSVINPNSALNDWTLSLAPGTETLNMTSSNGVACTNTEKSSAANLTNICTGPLYMAVEPTNQQTLKFNFTAMNHFDYQTKPSSSYETSSVSGSTETSTSSHVFTTSTTSSTEAETLAFPTTATTTSSATSKSFKSAKCWRIIFTVCFSLLIVFSDATVNVD